MFPTSTRLRPAKATTRILFVCLFLAALGAGLWTARPKQAEPPVVRKSQPKGVGALGRLEPGWKVIRVAPATSAEGAKVEKLPLKEGDFVQQGEFLAELDTYPRKVAALQEAEAQVKIAEARVAQIKAGAKLDEIAAQEATVSKWRTSLRHSEILFRRVEGLRGNGAVSVDEYDARQAEFESNREMLRQSESTLAALKTIRPEDIAAAEAERIKAQAGVARAKAELQATLIHAPISGRILKIYSYPGERIGESGLLDLGDTQSMHAVAEVYERDALKIRVGQQAFVKVQSLSREFQGEVVQIGWKVGRQVVFDNDPVKDTDARVVEVRILLNSEASQAVGGLTYARIEARIDTEGN